MSLADGAASIDAINRDRVLSETWGHLAPVPGRAYEGTIVFAHGEYGDAVPLRVAFDGLPESPWFYEGLCRFVGEQCAGAETRGRVFRWCGRYVFRVEPDVRDEDGFIEREGEQWHEFDGVVEEIPTGA